MQLNTCEHLIQGVGDGSGDTQGTGDGTGSPQGTGDGTGGTESTGKSSGDGGGSPAYIAYLKCLNDIKK